MKPLAVLDTECYRNFWLCKVRRLDTGAVREFQQLLMEVTDTTVAALCFPRPDDWIQNKRPDMPTQDYLLFPGN